METSSDIQIEHQAKLSRILHKVDKIKANLNLCTGTVNSDAVKLDDHQSAIQTSGIDYGEKPMSGDAATEEAIPFRKRPKLGKLPSYIPLD